MVVGVARVTFRLYDNHSLKGKRKVVKSIIDRTRHRFNISIAEVADQDVHQRATVGIAVVGSERRQLNSFMDRILGFLESLHLADPIDQKVEFFNLEKLVESDPFQQYLSGAGAGED
jgi:hypothetical protein